MKLHIEVLYRDDIPAEEFSINSIADLDEIIAKYPQLEETAYHHNDYEIIIKGMAEYLNGVGFRAYYTK